ncbi:hypothetical protein HJFPF1_05498 [Paramyrothecium foliicola]|nr:hypothetical protein HJFPF1_05498 [Paramyrothecium foliicola]
MATFHPFGRLPIELRAQIWEKAIEPRTVEVGFKKQDKVWGQVLHVTTSTPIPAIVQVCREARNNGLYQRAFCEGSNPRHIWVNFRIDLISIGHTGYWIISAERKLIRRLKFEGGNDEGFYHFRTHELREFCNLSEIQIICEPGLLEWQPAWQFLQWPCPRENLRFIDKQSGLMVDGYELDKMTKEWVGSMYVD